MAWVKALFEPRPGSTCPGPTAQAGRRRVWTFDGASHEGNHYVMTSDYVTAGRTPDGRLAVAYMPSLRPLKINLSALNGPVTARWSRPEPRRFPQSKVPLSPILGQPYFIPPGNNADGYGDWLWFSKPIRRRITAIGGEWIVEMSK